MISKFLPDRLGIDGEGGLILASAVSTLRTLTFHLKQFLSYDAHFSRYIDFLNYNKHSV